MAKHVRVGKIEVEYDEAGTGGRPFVMVHGFTGSRDDFADVLETLGELVEGRHPRPRRDEGDGKRLPRGTLAGLRQRMRDDRVLLPVPGAAQPDP